MSLQDGQLFIGRKKEREQLGRFLDTPRSAIAVIYGRRRIGKTELIRQVLKGYPSLFFDGLEGQRKPQQIRKFLFQFKQQTGIEHKGTLPRTWLEAFDLLLPYLEKTPSTIVLDEFQWMANYRMEIVSDLKLIWDQYWSRTLGVNLILCGSIASFMKEKVVKSQALYGRAEVILHLKPFTLRESARLLPEYGKAEVLAAQMIVGGVPQYLSLLKGFPSFLLAMEALAFTENGYFTTEYERIFLSHFEKNPDYQAIIRTLAAYPYGLYRKEIVERAGVDGGGRLTEHLMNLEVAGFISSCTPVDKGPDSRIVKYELTDAYLRFYFAFILPNLKRLESKADGIFFERVTNSGAYHAWLGRAFENVVGNHSVEISRLLGFSGIDFTCGPYFRPKRGSQPGIQVDLLFDRADQVLTLCEMKYYKKRVGASVIPEITNRVADLEARFPNKTIQSLLITMNGVTRDVEAAMIPSRTMLAEELF